MEDIMKKNSISSSLAAVSPMACPCSTYCSGSKLTTPGMWQRQDEINASIQASIQNTKGQMGAGDVLK